MSEKNYTILIAGDYVDELEQFADHLRSEKFNVLPVRNRESVVTLARSELPSLIVLDFPTCFDVCRMLKHNFVTESIPIIAILFPAEEVDRVAVMELGADDCMAKPFNFRELTLRIKCSLKRAEDKKGLSRYQKAQHYSALMRRSSETGRKLT